MIEPLAPNTQAILLLTAPLISASRESRLNLLSLSEYNQLARLLREQQKQPADLLAEDAAELIQHCGQSVGHSRLEALLRRGFVLSQAVERWHTRAIWVISRADPRYPKRLKTRLKEETPPLLYGCGDLSLLEKEGLAVMGSRQAGADATSYSQSIGRLSAGARRLIISGGSAGIGKASMDGALGAGGEAVVVLADSLEKAALDRENRQPLMRGRLTLVSPYDPGTGVQLDQTRQRDKLIYALADAALVVATDLEDEAWTGAIQQLEKFRFAPLYVRNVGKGNVALLDRGAKPWPDPKTADELANALG